MIEKKSLKPIDRLAKATGHKVLKKNTVSGYPSGHHPNSKKNLVRKDYSQSYATRLATRINWLLFQLKGANGNLTPVIADIDDLIKGYPEAFKHLSKERQMAIVAVMYEIDKVFKAQDNLIAKIRAIKETPTYPRARPSKPRQERPEST
jgi:hypothetical protein